MWDETIWAALPFGIKAADTSVFSGILILLTINLIFPQKFKRLNTIRTAEHLSRLQPMLTEKSDMLSRQRAFVRETRLSCRKKRRLLQEIECHSRIFPLEHLYIILKFI